MLFQPRCAVRHLRRRALASSSAWICSTALAWPSSRRPFLMSLPPSLTRSWRSLARRSSGLTPISISLAAWLGLTISHLLSTQFCLLCEPHTSWPMIANMETGGCACLFRNRDPPQMASVVESAEPIPAMKDPPVLSSVALKWVAIFQDVVSSSRDEPLQNNHQIPGHMDHLLAPRRLAGRRKM